MKVLVCGGRDYSDYEALKVALDALHERTPITTLVSGHARGADSLGERWARETGIDISVYPAQWSVHGRAAGHIRNQQMLDSEHPDLVIAFPGGRGTADMIRRAKASGTRVVEV